MCEIDIGNLKTRKTLRLLSSGTKLLFTFFSLKVIRQEGRERERERHNLSMLTFPSAPPPPPPPRAASSRKLLVWSRRAPKVNLPPRQELNSLLFLKSQPTLPVRDVIHTLGLNCYLGFLLWHLWMTHPLYTRVNTCVNVAPN